MLAGNEDIHKSLGDFAFRSDPTTDSLEHLKINVIVSTFSHLLLIRTLFILVGNTGMHFFG